MYVCMYRVALLAYAGEALSVAHDDNGGEGEDLGWRAGGAAHGGQDPTVRMRGNGVRDLTLPPFFTTATRLTSSTFWIGILRCYQTTR